jgi:RimJ/RimL family protein N-acetyltransferase
MIGTERLILRPWRAGDATAFAAINADPEVMAHFPAPLPRDESDALLGRLMRRWRETGLAFSAAERRADGAVVGMVGLSRIGFGAPSPLNGCVEVGWRLARAYWGEGYATEAARAWITHGFDAVGCDEIVAFTVPANRPSQAVMRRLGMVRDPSRDFAHPGLQPGHPLRPHILYRLRNEERGG